MLLFISQRVNTLPPFIRNQNGLFQLINRLEWVFSLLAKSIEHGSIFFGYMTYNESDGIRLDVELADSTFPRPFLVLPPLAGGGECRRSSKDAQPKLYYDLLAKEKSLNRKTL